MDDTRLAGEVRRAFGARRFDHSLEQLLIRRRVSRPLRPWLLVASAAVAGITLWAVSSTPVPGGPQAVFAGWGPVPSQPSATLAGSALTACGPGGELDGMTMVGQDQRGNAAAFVFANADQLSLCLLVEDPSGAVLAATTGSTRLTPETGALSVDSGISQPKTSNAGGLTILGGRVVAGVNSVEIERHDGVSVTATVTDGYFLAWWPTSDKAERIVAKDAGGKRMADLNSPF